MQTINLDNHDERRAFISRFGNLSGRMLANRLSLHGTGSTDKAMAILGYAHNRETAHACAEKGEPWKAVVYDAIAEKCFARIPYGLRWREPNFNPLVTADVMLAESTGNQIRAWLERATESYL